MNETNTHIRQFSALVGEENVIANATEITRALRDNSWLSPLLRQYIDQRRSSEGSTMQVLCVVMPQDVEQLRSIIAYCVRHSIPMVARGGGTSNFGQTVPMQGGVILDMRHLAGILEVGESTITVAAGTLQGDVDKAARAHGKELTVLTTTYANATAAGWVAGGHVGLGANTYGTIWDGNVLGVTILTAEDPPRQMVLAGDDLLPVLHTYGATGLITEVTFPLVKARDWLETVGVFDRFEDAVAFTAAMAAESSIVQRVVTAQDGDIAPGFTPLRALFSDGQSLVLMMVDAAAEGRCRDLCLQHGGELRNWQITPGGEKISLGLMVYGHRMLWIKKIAPDSAFLHIYYSPERYVAQRESIKTELGEQVWEEFKYIRSAWLRRLQGLEGHEPLPAAVLTLTPGSEELLHRAMAVCTSVGVNYMNPHTFLLEETGLFPDFQRIADFKRLVDPKGLLNPGKIGARYLKQEIV
jgi:FAD/FMN-containing dehydrogenase